MPTFDDVRTIALALPQAEETRWSAAPEALLRDVGGV